MIIVNASFAHSFPCFHCFLMNLATWNCRGAGAPIFIRHLKDMVRTNQIGIIAVLEPRVSGPTAQKIIKRTGFLGSAVVEACGFAGGIWLLWDKNIWDVSIILTDNQLIHAKVGLLNSNDYFMFSVVYASPNPTKRTHLWKLMEVLARSIEEPWCLAGHFNTYLGPMKRWVALFIIGPQSVTLLNVSKFVISWIWALKGHGILGQEEVLVKGLTVDFVIWIGN